MGLYAMKWAFSTPATKVRGAGPAFRPWSVFRRAQRTQELKDTHIVVNSISPGYVKTDLNGHSGVMSVEDGAKLPVKHALLG